MSIPGVSVLDQLVSRAGHLYTLPAVAMRVLQLTDDPKIDTRALKECIENDPALTTKILRVVNSSLFGLSREVSDLNQAIALLGTKPLKLLVLGFSLPSGFFAGLSAEMFGRYWRHTLTKAVAAREISETLWQQPGDEAFIAGLLQDLGMLVLIQELGSPYLEFLDKVYQRGADVLALETESLGFDHTLLSSRLLDHWGLPPALVEAVRRETSGQSPAFASSDASQLSRILALAEHMAAWLADERADALEALLHGAAERQGLSAGQLEAIVASLEEKVRQLADVLSLKLPQGREYSDVLRLAHERLAEVAAEAAGDLLSRRKTQGAAEPALAEHVRSLHEAAARFSPREVRTPSAVVDTAVEPVHYDPFATVASPAAAPPATAVATASPRVNSTSFLAEADPGVSGQLAAAVNACRQARCALSVLLVELNDMDNLVLTRGVEGFAMLRRFLASACRSLDQPHMVCLPQGEAGFALILSDCDRSSAVHLGNLLIDRVRRLAAISDPDHRSALSLNVGVATVSLPPKNFPPGDLLVAADRCLYGSRASGSGVVKSIEIY